LSAKILASEIGLGASIAAALMHDVVEDNSITVKAYRKCSTQSSPASGRFTKISLVQKDMNVLCRPRTFVNVAYLMMYV
jgi:hypothetical protein